MQSIRSQGRHNLRVFGTLGQSTIPPRLMGHEDPSGLGQIEITTGKQNALLWASITGIAGFIIGSMFSTRVFR